MKKPFLLIFPLLLVGSFLVGRLNTNKSEQPQTVVQRESSLYEESEEFFFPGWPLTLHVPFSFYLSDARLVFTPNGNGKVCGEITAPTAQQNTLLITFADSQEPCTIETSYPNASNVVQEGSVRDFCDTQNVAECSALDSLPADWEGIHGFAFAPDFAEPKTAPGSIARFYAFTNQTTPSPYDTFTVTLLPSDLHVAPDAFNERARALQKEPASDDAAFPFWQDMQTLETLVKQIEFIQ